MGKYRNYLQKAFWFFCITLLVSALIATRADGQSEQFSYLRFFLIVSAALLPLMALRAVTDVWGDGRVQRAQEAGSAPNVIVKIKTVCGMLDTAEVLMVGAVWVAVSRYFGVGADLPSNKVLLLAAIGILLVVTAGIAVYQYIVQRKLEDTGGK